MNLNTISLMALVRKTNKIAVLKSYQILALDKDHEQGSYRNSGPALGSHLALGPRLVQGPHSQNVPVLGPCPTHNLPREPLIVQLWQVPHHWSRLPMEMILWIQCARKSGGRILCFWTGFEFFLLRWAEEVNFKPAAIEAMKELMAVGHFNDSFMVTQEHIQGIMLIWTYFTCCSAYATILSSVSYRPWLHHKTSSIYCGLLILVRVVPDLSSSRCKTAERVRTSTVSTSTKWNTLLAGTYWLEAVGLSVMVCFVLHW
jgi:hypothetical protein